MRYLIAIAVYIIAAAAPLFAQKGCPCDASEYFWICPYENGTIGTAKWQITIDWDGTPADGQCDFDFCALPGDCKFDGATVTMKNLTGGSLNLLVGSANGTGTPPDPNNPPQGGTLDRQSTTPTTIASGASFPFDVQPRKEECDSYFIYDISYTAGDCPTSCADGWGTCSILDLFMSCAQCEAAGGG